MPLEQASQSKKHMQAPSNKIPSAPEQSHQQMNRSQNIFTIEEPRLQSCLIQVLGEQRYYELRTMQPNREEMSKIGPCMPLAQGSNSLKSLQAPSNNKQIAPEQRLPPTSAGTPPPRLLNYHHRPPPETTWLLLMIPKARPIIEIRMK